MKINTEEKHKICIGDICYGEVFWYKDEYYIKVSHIEDINAINLSSGFPKYFEETDSIIAFPNAALVIK